MAIIHVLPKNMAELIAAGEVVERPAAVIKELVENAIDAGATTITVEIKNGGISYMRVTDNGSGIDRAQVQKAFLRHATSKILTEEDLYSLNTLGFRGEALASVAAMCKVELLTRTQGEELGTRYCIEGGCETLCEDAGCPQGTTIVVRDIFYNTPARMKFLKKDVTEGNTIEALLDKMALSHPEVALKLIRDGVPKLQTPGDSKLISAIYSVYDKDFATGLLEVNYQSGPYSLCGYICKPERAKPSRAYQNFYINSRFIRSKTCFSALEQAYKHAVMVGKFPYCVLHITMSPQVLDVNVHPAKTEVRFADEKAIFDLVYYGCKQALSTLEQATTAADRGFKSSINAYSVQAAPTTGVQQRLEVNVPLYNKPQPYQPAPVPEPVPAPVMEKPTAAMPFKPATTPPVQSAPTLAPMQPQPAPKLEEPVLEPATEPQTVQAEYSIIGELFNTYILVACGEELLLVDKHAAHERILFEELCKGDSFTQTQMLLESVPVHLDKELYGAAVQNIEIFAKFGFAVEDFGRGMLLIRETPLLLTKDDAAAMVEEIATKLHTGARELTPAAIDELFHSVACKAAVKAGARGSTQEREQILRLLRQDLSIRNCPHGRPVMISITKKEIEKLFGRI